MEEAPVTEVGPMEGVTMCEAVSATMEDGRRTKTATVDRHPTTSEPTAVKGRSAAAEATAMETAAAAETTAATMKRRAAARSAAASEAATATAAARRLDLGRQPVGCKFR